MKPDYRLAPGRCAGLLVAATWWPASALEPPTTQQIEQSESAFVVHDSALIGPNKSFVFAHQPDGLTARTLVNGEPVWSQATAARPLGLFGPYLVAFSPGEAATEGQVDFLDPATGETLESLAVQFPSPVRPRLEDRPGKQFSISARIFEEDLFLSWQHASRDLRGAPQDHSIPTIPDNAHSSDNPDTAVHGRQRHAGGFKIDVAAPSATPLTADQLPPEPEPFIPDVGNNDPASTGHGRVFRAHDEKHRISSTDLGPDRWKRYQWEILDAGTGEEIATLNLPFAYAPFFVSNATLIFISQPYVRQSDSEGELTAQGLRMNALEMANGQRTWSIRLIDPVYRGVLPP